MPRDEGKGSAIECDCGLFVGDGPALVHRLFQVETVESALRIAGGHSYCDGRPWARPRRGGNFDAGNFDQALAVLADEAGRNVSGADGGDVVFEGLKPAGCRKSVSPVFLCLKVLTALQV